MLSTTFKVLLASLALTSKVAAHGVITGIIASGVYYQGYLPSFQYKSVAPKVVGWTIPQDLQLGYVDNYTDPDLICHLAATPGQAYATVSAGSTIDLQWSAWPTSHHGPLLDYLAPCGADCTTINKTTLLWTKIDASGLTGISNNPQTWATDDMIANNNTWTVTIPSSIAPGKYVLRNEIIALHSAFNLSGAQNYPQCINLLITGNGTNTLLTGGTAYDKLYTPQDPGILINIYQTLKSYIIPGPAALQGGSTSNSSSNTSSTATSTTTSVGPTTFATSTTSSNSTTHTTSNITTTITTAHSTTSTTVTTANTTTTTSTSSKTTTMQSSNSTLATTTLILSKTTTTQGSSSTLTTTTPTSSKTTTTQSSSFVLGTTTKSATMSTITVSASIVNGTQIAALTQSNVVVVLAVTMPGTNGTQRAFMCS